MSQPAWQRTRTLASPSVIDRDGFRSSCAGHWALRCRPFPVTRLPLRSRASMSLVNALLAAYPSLTAGLAWRVIVSMSSLSQAQRDPLAVTARGSCFADWASCPSGLLRAMSTRIRAGLGELPLHVLVDRSGGHDPPGADLERSDLTGRD